MSGEGARGNLAAVGPALRVLLLEDERVVALLVAEHLRAVEGVACAITMADTLAAALERLASQPFDLVIADLNLPDCTGALTIDRLVAACRQPVIALTADPDPGLRAQVLARGAYDFLAKGRLDEGALPQLVRLAALQARTLASLRESEERFRSLTALSSDWYWEQDAQFRLTFMSRRLGERTGIEAADYLGRQRWEQPALNLSEADWAAHRAQLERRQPFRDFEMQRPLSDGSSRWLSISGEPVFDADGNFRGYRGIGREITREKLAQQALRESEARFRSLVELSSDFYWETDAEHRLTHSTHDVKHRPASEPIIGKRRWEVPSILPDEAGWAAHRAALAARRPFRDFEMARIDPDGVRRHLSISGEPVFGPGGEFAGYRGVGRDITAQRREQRLTNLEHAVARDLAGAKEVPGALRAVMRAVCESEGWDAARFFRVDAEAQVLRCEEVWAPGSGPLARFVEESRGTARPPGFGLVAHVWQSGEPVWIADVGEDPRLGSATRVREAGVHGAFLFPVTFEGGVLGVLSVSSSTVQEPDERLMQTMRVIGAQIGQFLKRTHGEAALQRFRTALDSAADMVFLFDVASGRLLDFNETACAYLGYSREELLRLTGKDIRVGVTAESLRAETAEVIRGGGRRNTVLTEYRRKDGSTFPVESHRSLIDTPQGRVLLINSRDLSERMRAEKRRAAQARYQKKISRLGQAALSKRDPAELVAKAVQSVLEGLGGGAVAYFERGEDPGELVLRRAAGVDAPGGAAALRFAAGAPLAPVLERSESVVLGAPWRPAPPLPASWLARYAAAAFVAVPGGRGPRGVLCALAETPGAFGPEETRFLGAAASMMSAALHRLDSEARLAYLAQFDPLTGLPNRTLLADRFGLMIMQARRRGASLGVLFIDLDDFKVVNDTQGHAAGDELLKQAARRLQAAVRDGDTVARISGDEFAVILSDLARPDDAALVAQKMLDRLGVAFDIQGQEAIVTASVGIATFPADGDNAEALLGAADAAMYRAKQAGRNGFQFFTADINQRTRARALLGAELRRALERREFTLHYQPKIDLATGRPCGAEALLRWEHPERGRVAPVEFIPVLEETGLIVPVGEWVLRRACADLKTWQRIGLPAMPVAVNLSARQFRQHDLDQRIRGIVEESGVDPALVELEITESQLMHDPDHAVRVLERLGEAGLRIAIDDFGTGYSSLAYLTRFPLASLKIDRSFVADVLDDEADATIVRTIVDMAHTLGFTVIAEGVELDSQAAFLRALGCEQAQGFLFARPMPAEDFSALIAKRIGVTASTRPKRSGTKRRKSGS